MSRTSRMVKRLLEEADQLPYGPAERDLLDRAVALADEVQDTGLGHLARFRLIQSAGMTRDVDALLSAFAWCLGMHQRDPRRHPLRTDSGDLLWFFKWIPPQLAADPRFGREQIAALLEQMEETYRRAGAGRNGVLHARLTEAVHSGRLAEADRLHTELMSSPRDEYSDCHACVLSESASVLYLTGRPDDGLRAFEELVAEGHVCNSEPAGAMADALLPLLRAGRASEAVEFHRRGYRQIRDSDRHLPSVADHIVFCAVTGNTARGLRLIERHLGAVRTDTLVARSRFQVLASMATLLDAVTREGHGSLPVRNSNHAGLRPVLGDHEGDRTVEQLASASWDTARRLAGQFDARNGNDFFSAWLREFEALADERYDIPMDDEHGAPAWPQAAAAPDPQDAAEWVRRALEQAHLGTPSEALAAAQSGLDASPSLA